MLPTACPLIFAFHLQSRLLEILIFETLIEKEERERGESYIKHCSNRPRLETASELNVGIRRKLVETLYINDCSCFCLCVCASVCLCLCQCVVWLKPTQDIINHIPAQVMYQRRFQAQESNTVSFKTLGWRAKRVKWHHPLTLLGGSSTDYFVRLYSLSSCFFCNL